MSFVAVNSSPRLEEKKVDSLSISSVQEPRVRYLEGEVLDRFNAFFKDRIYRYKAGLGGGEFDLEFPVSFPVYLQNCVAELKARGIEVEGVYVKGGAFHQIYTGSDKPLADLDITIKIKAPQSWKTVEESIGSPLCSKEMGNIQWKDEAQENHVVRTYYRGDKKLFSESLNYMDLSRNIFSCKGAKTNRHLTNNEKEKHALYTLPLFYKGKRQEVDIHVVAEVPASCFCSYDASRIWLGDNDHLFEKPYFTTVEGYGLRESLESIDRSEFTVDPDRVKNVREGLRGFNRILTKGICPKDTGYEKILWENFIAEYKPTQFAYFGQNLSNYVSSHYHRTPLSKVFYLLNYYETFNRAVEFNGLTLEEKEKLELEILSQVYKSVDLEMPKDLQAAREEVEAIQAYFYLLVRNRAPNPEQFCLLKTESSDYLWFRSPKKNLKDLWTRIEKKVSHFALLSHFAKYTPDLAEFFTKRIARDLDPKQKEQALEMRSNSPEEPEQLLLDQIRDPQFIISEDWIHQLEEQLLSYLKEGKVNLPYNILVAAMEREEIQISPKFLELIFERFCQTSMAAAGRLFTKLKLPSSFISIFAKYIQVETDVKKFIEIIKKNPSDELLDLVALRVFEEFPNQIPDLIELISQCSEEFQRNFGVQLLDSNRVEKKNKGLYFDGKKDELFFDRINGELAVKSIQFYLETLTAKNQLDQAVAFYQKFEQLILKSRSFSEIFQSFVFPACLNKSRGAIDLIASGLKEMKRRSQMDRSSLKALAILSKFPLVSGVVEEEFFQLVQMALNEELENSPDLERLKNLKRPGQPDAKKSETAPKEKTILKLGKDYLAGGNYRDALKEFSKIENPTNEILISCIVPCYVGLKKIDRCIHIFDTIIDSDLENESNWEKYFEFSEKQKITKDFIKRLESKAAENKKSVGLRKLLISYYDRVLSSEPADIKKRAAVFVELSRLEPKNAEWPKQYGYMCLKLKLYDKAIGALKIACELDPNDLECITVIAECQYMDKQNPKEALKAMDQYLFTIANDRSLDMAENRALAYTYQSKYRLYSGDKEGAMESFKQAIKFDPENTFVMRKYAEFIFEQYKMADEALSVIRKNIDRRRLKGESYQDVLDDMVYAGWLCLNTGSDAIHAAHYLEEVVKHRPDYKLSDNYLAALIIRKGSYREKARAALERGETGAADSFNFLAKRDEDLIKEINRATGYALKPHIIG